ncbi:hypothetical protein [Polyangium spumosum]|uniref:Uncharacterized protein n=1 Tax=Polyangium spumosum TaxID=889282 RepID=A0A6N7PF84_9BACT|nr:hypothetical protein [Polyangium spumosum]MRG90713.1 hypothetical protein [Polyangium spumosum]
MNPVPLLLIASLILGLGAGCRTRPTKKNRYEGLDGGYVMRPECDLPSDACFEKCYKRKASVTCFGCCRDRRFLCDTQQPHSFESCDNTQ